MLFVPSWLTSHADVTLSPTIQFPLNAEGASRLVLMVDLDAPDGSSNRSYSPLLHWLQSSIGPTINEIPVNYSSNPEAFYWPPSPPPGSGPHKYVVLAFNQPSANFSMPTEFAKFNATYRFVFDVQTFINDAGLGSPIGSYWFTAQNASSTDSPAVYAGASSRSRVLHMFWVILVIPVIWSWVWVYSRVRSGWSEESKTLLFPI